MTMPKITIKLGQDAAFDEAVHGGLPEGGDLTVITKDKGTEGGRACVALTFTVDIGGGVLKRAQHVTTVRALATVLRALEARYEDGRVRVKQ